MLLSPSPLSLAVREEEVVSEKREGETSEGLGGALALAVVGNPEQLRREQ